MYDEKIIDKKNQTGYNQIADEYNDAQRKSTNVLHLISKSHFELFCKKNSNMNYNKKVLDVGCGKGFLLAIIEKYYFKISAIDISDQMILSIENNFKNVHFYTIPVSKINTLNTKFDIIFSSLSSSFLTSKNISSIYNNLNETGTFIFTCISSIYANKTRHKTNRKHKNIFTLSNGEKVEVYSFVFTKNKIKHLLLSHGFIDIEITPLYTYIDKNNNISVYQDNIHSEKIETLLFITAKKGVL